MEDMTLRGYSASTQKLYLSKVICFAKYHGKSPSELAEEEMAAIVGSEATQYDGELGDYGDYARDQGTYPEDYDGLGRLLIEVEEDIFHPIPSMPWITTTVAYWVKEYTYVGDTDVVLTKTVDYYDVADYDFVEYTATGDPLWEKEYSYIYYGAGPDDGKLQLIIGNNYTFGTSETHFYQYYTDQAYTEYHYMVLQYGVNDPEYFGANKLLEFHEHYDDQLTYSAINYRDIATNASTYVSKYLGTDITQEEYTENQSGDYTLVHYYNDASMVKEYEVNSMQVLKLTQESGCSAYDCEFVNLAQDLNVPLITMDKKVLNKFRTTATNIQDYIKING